MATTAGAPDQPPPSVPLLAAPLDARALSGALLVLTILAGAGWLGVWPLKRTPAPAKPNKRREELVKSIRLAQLAGGTINLASPSVPASTPQDMPVPRTGSTRAADDPLARDQSRSRSSTLVLHPITPAEHGDRTGKKKKGRSGAVTPLLELAGSPALPVPGRSRTGSAAEPRVPTTSEVGVQTEPAADVNAPSVHGGAADAGNSGTPARQDMEVQTSPRLLATRLSIAQLPHYNLHASFQSTPPPPSASTHDPRPTSPPLSPSPRLSRSSLPRLSQQNGLSPVAALLPVSANARRKQNRRASLAAAPVSPGASVVGMPKPPRPATQERAPGSPEQPRAGPSSELGGSNLSPTKRAGGSLPNGFSARGSPTHQTNGLPPVSPRRLSAHGPPPCAYSVGVPAPPSGSSSLLMYGNNLHLTMTPPESERRSSSSGGTAASRGRFGKESGMFWENGEIRSSSSSSATGWEAENLSLGNVGLGVEMSTDEKGRERRTMNTSGGSRSGSEPRRGGKGKGVSETEDDFTPTSAGDGEMSWSSLPSGSSSKAEPPSTPLSVQPQPAAGAWQVSAPSVASSASRPGSRQSGRSSLGAPPSHHQLLLQQQQQQAYAYAHAHAQGLAQAQVQYQQAMAASFQQAQLAAGASLPLAVPGGWSQPSSPHFPPPQHAQHPVSPSSAVFPVIYPYYLAPNGSTNHFASPPAGSMNYFLPPSSPLLGGNTSSRHSQSGYSNSSRNGTTNGNGGGRRGSPGNGNGGNGNDGKRGSVVLESTGWKVKLRTAEMEADRSGKELEIARWRLVVLEEDRASNEIENQEALAALASRAQRAEARLRVLEARNAEESTESVEGSPARSKQRAEIKDDVTEGDDGKERERDGVKVHPLAWLDLDSITFSVQAPPQRPSFLTSPVYAGRRSASGSNSHSTSNSSSMNRRVPPRSPNTDNYGVQQGSVSSGHRTRRAPPNLRRRSTNTGYATNGLPNEDSEEDILIVLDSPLRRKASSAAIVGSPIQEMDVLPSPLLGELEEYGIVLGGEEDAEPGNGSAELLEGGAEEARGSNFIGTLPTFLRESSAPTGLPAVTDGKEGNDSDEEVVKGDSLVTLPSFILDVATPSPSSSSDPYPRPFFPSPPLLESNTSATQEAGGEIISPVPRPAELTFVTKGGRPKSA